MLRLRVARLMKAHGLKGGIKLELYTDEPDKRFVAGARFQMQVPEDSPWHGMLLTLGELRWYNGHPVAFFAEIPDRTVAETAIKAILLVDKEEEQLPDEPGAWYDHQLVGLAAVRDGERIGEVSAVEHLPAQDLLVVRVRAGVADAEPREVLVPFVGAFVPDVDLSAGTVTLTPPPGLFEQVDEDVRVEDAADAD